MIYVYTASIKFSSKQDWICFQWLGMSGNWHTWQMYDEKTGSHQCWHDEHCGLYTKKYVYFLFAA